MSEEDKQALLEVANDLKIGADKTANAAMNFLIESAHKYKNMKNQNQNQIDE